MEWSGKLFSAELEALMVGRPPGGGPPLRNAEKLEKRVKITFAHIKSQSGNVGNEIAHEMAKKATKYGEKLDWPIPLQFIKNISVSTREYIGMLSGNKKKILQWIKKVNKIPAHLQVAGYYWTR